jgi:hypothetical protein
MVRNAVVGLTFPAILTAVLAVLAPPRTALANDAPPDVAVRIEPKDSDAAKTALALTNALRAATTRHHPKRAKDTDAAIARADCSILQPACAASVGASLAVSHMLVGQLERRGARYTLTLSLVNVHTKQRVRSLRDTFAKSANLPRLARSLYSRILDEGTGELVIAANAQRGQVLLDGLAVTELYEGRATVSGVALGTHALEIRAAGFHPFTSDVEVDGRTEQNVLLDPAP